ncbi:MAG: hypothetical protein GXY58_00495 [Planctomycetaceae bacterium]|mgnify:CR=1 FL=1|nr:hypothetical protein [Planctomycetaceae bacterium]
MTGQPEQPRARPHRWRWCGRVVLAAAAALATLRLTSIQGCLRPVRITGGSMADAFCGPHFPVTCHECGMPFRCGTEFPPAGNLATCPNCGCHDNPVDTSRPAPGQRVVIDRWAGKIPGLRVWQAVAIRTPHDPHRLTVKRLVARGPGRVAIRDGDVYLNHQIQRKSLAQLRDVRILVHDDTYRAPQADRWQPARPDAAWKATSTGYVFVPATRPDLQVQWLDYTQWTCWPHDDPDRDRTQHVPIFDHDAYNQSLSRGGLHPVPDIMLACQLQVSEPGHCILRLTSRGDEFTWDFAAAPDNCQLRWNGRAVATAPGPHRPAPWLIELAACDQRLLAAVDGVIVFEFPYQPTAGASRDQRRLSIGGRDAHVRFETPRVYRDLHYGGPGGAERWEASEPLQAAEWFVLGDNVPISIDSRLWSAIAGRDILGPVRPWIRFR